MAARVAKILFIVLRTLRLVLAPRGRYDFALADVTPVLVSHQRPRVGVRVFGAHYLILAGVLSFLQQKESTKESAGPKNRSTLGANARPPFWRIARLLSFGSEPHCRSLRDRLFWRIALLLSCAINNQVLGASDSVMESLRAMIRCSSFAEKAMADEGAGIMDEFILG